MSKIAITIGDPAGVGAELIIKLLPHFERSNTYIIYGEEKTLISAGDLVGAEFEYEKISSPQEAESEGIYLIDMNISSEAVPSPSITSGKVAVAYLARAVVDAVYGYVDGILTMPISKFWAKRAGFSYEGQTEYLAQATNTEDYAMCMYSEDIKVVLLTTHIPLSDVPNRVKKEDIKRVVLLTAKEFRSILGREPSIGVLGLNPHAGEGGDIGTEDMEEILPAVEELKSMSLRVEGPLVPDTAFLKRKDYDVFVCMYHDQALIPFKILAFEEGVNVTLGLPFPRTSPDHGTAYDIAWKGIADPRPSVKALELLERLIEVRRS